MYFLLKYNEKVCFVVKKILIDDWASLKIMSPYIFLGVMLVLIFIAIQLILCKKDEKNEEES